MTHLGSTTFTKVGTLTAPSGVLGLIDPCQIDTTNKHANHDAWGARIAVGFEAWDAHTRLVDGEVAELRLVPAGTPADRVRIDWDGVIPDLATRGMSIRSVGDVGIYTSTCIVIDPAHTHGFDYDHHVQSIDEDATAWAIPTTDIPAGAVITTTGCGSGAYDIHLVTTHDASLNTSLNTSVDGSTVGALAAIVINFGLDHEISRCPECYQPDGQCVCEPCITCGDYYAPGYLNSDDLCDTCAEEARHEDEDEDEA